MLAELVDRFREGFYRTGFHIFSRIAVAAALVPASWQGLSARPVVSIVSICQIQGDGISSLHRGQSLTTIGFVHADFDTAGANGFYIQDADCDTNPATSDGLFVHLSDGVDVVASGDRVQVSGEVRELYGMTELYADPGGVQILSSGNGLPSPVELDPPADYAASRIYYEAREGMRVQITDASVTGPTDSGDQTWVLAAHWGLERLFWDDLGLDSAVMVVDDGGLYEITPEAKVGDGIAGAVGALQQRYALYRLQLSEQVDLIQNPGTIPEPVGASDTKKTFTLSSFNLSNLFDTLDDPDNDDEVLAESTYWRRVGKVAATIHTWLGEPDLLAVQEVENLVVLEALVTQPQIMNDYGVVLQEGPDRRGLDVAYLYRRDRVQLLETSTLQGCTKLVDGLGPDGNQDVERPANLVTCDADGDGDLEGNRLFSRPPLLAHLRLCFESCTASDPKGEGVTLWAVNVHLKSQVEDTPESAYTAARRLRQAAFLQNAVAVLRSSHPGESVLVLGDFNDNPGSAAIQTIEMAGLTGVSARLSRQRRYSYVFDGVSELLDDVYHSLSPEVAVRAVDIVHINADTPAVFETIAGIAYRSSDHDPVWVEISHLSNAVYMPILEKP